MKSLPLISVVVRVRNEEAWLRHCLRGIRNQREVETEIIVVDNQSSDLSMQVAQEMNVNQIVRVDDYSPGKALNRGIEASTGEYVAFISGHCIPADSYWLIKLLKEFSNSRVAGAYGRQLPMSFTHPLDRNDLLMAFGIEPRIQTKDWFFHNANSMVRRTIWESLPFNEETSTIEDRLWAKEAIDKGYWISYTPVAKVFHHNGLHRTSDESRIPGHVEVIESISGGQVQGSFGWLDPNDLRLTAILPVKAERAATPDFIERYPEVEARLLNSQYVKNIVVVSPGGSVGGNDVIRIDRNLIPGQEILDIDDFLALVVSDVEQLLGVQDFFLFVSSELEESPRDFFDSLAIMASSHGFDTVFGSVREFGHFWVRSENRTLQEVDSSFSPKPRREPLWKALYGLGTLVRASILRKGALTGGSIGMLELVSSGGGFQLKSEVSNGVLPAISGARA